MTLRESGASGPQRPRVGVSACLLGAGVRFDGGHKRDTFLTGTLNEFVDWVTVCPEEEAGLGVPRESMRLVADGPEIRLLTVRTQRDLTAQVRLLAERRAAELSGMNLDGFILKKDSPSCGPSRVKVYGDHGIGTRGGTGLFAQALRTAAPLLPIEDEGRLHDPAIREHFISRVFAHRRLRALLDRGPHPRDLVAFHTAHKLQLLAYSPAAYAGLGRLVARAGRAPIAEVAAEYGRRFATALQPMATVGRHVNVLQHAAGYFRRLLSSPARRDIDAAIADYQSGVVPLVVPLRLISHHVVAHQVQYLAAQCYFDPYPKALMLRNA